MLRTITAKQFQERRAFSELYPAGEERMDIRFALLASVIAGSAGAKGRDGNPYTAESFLKALRPTEEGQPSSSGRKQSVAQMESMLKSWTDASNKARSERGQR